MEFLYLFLYRSISGAQNGLGYARSPKLPIATLLMILFCIALIAFAIATRGPVALRIGGALCGLLAFASAIMVDQSFDSRGGGRIYDIHFWETITTGAITLGVVLVGGNLFLVAASIYPALIIHKGFVNLGSGLPWWDKRTDDTTGKTFTIPLINLSVPRSSTKARVLISAASILLAVLTFVLKWSFTLYVLTT